MSEKFIQKDSAVINTDDRAYAEYLAARRRLRIEKSETESIKHRVSVLETEVENLKQALNNLLK
jgi:hypothetical protein